MNFFKLRCALNWEMANDIPKMLRIKKIKNVEYYACKINVDSGDDWQFVFHCKLKEPGRYWTTIRMHIVKADDLFKLDSHWITDKRAGIDGQQVNMDPLTLGRIRLLRIVYDFADEVSNDWEDVKAKYNLNTNRDEIQFTVFSSGQISYE